MYKLSIILGAYGGHPVSLHFAYLYLNFSMSSHPANTLITRHVWVSPTISSKQVGLKLIYCLSIF